MYDKQWRTQSDGITNCEQRFMWEGLCLFIVVKCSDNEVLSFFSWRRHFWCGTHRSRAKSCSVLEKIHASFRLVGFQKFWLALFSDVFPRRSPTVVDGRSALVLLCLVLHCARASMLPGFLFNLFIISILTIDVDRLKFYADRLL